MLKKIFSICCFICVYTFPFAQTTIVRDAAIENMVNEVSADSLKAYIATMVNFGTRNTQSMQTNSKRGIGAARNWIISKFSASTFFPSFPPKKPIRSY